MWQEYKDDVFIPLKTALGVITVSTKSLSHLLSTELIQDIQSNVTQWHFQAILTDQIPHSDNSSKWNTEMNEKYWQIVIQIMWFLKKTMYIYTNPDKHQLTDSITSQEDRLDTTNYFEMIKRSNDEVMYSHAVDYVQTHHND